MIPQLILLLINSVNCSGIGSLIDIFLSGYERGRQAGNEFIAESLLGKLIGIFLLVCILVIVFIGPFWIIHKKKKRNILYNLLINNDLHLLIDNDELSDVAGVYVSKLMDIENEYKSGIILKEERSRQIKNVILKIY